MLIVSVGKRTKKALEALKCAKALDAFQDGWHLGKFYEQEINDVKRI